MNRTKQKISKKQKRMDNFIRLKSNTEQEVREIVTTKLNNNSDQIY